MADKGLLCGINDYANVSDLRGCENDVRDVARLLTETFEFSEHNIRRHVNDAVTKAAVRDGFRWLIDGANAGDRLVFHFSGHGSYTESENDDEAVDELICLYDMSWDNPDSYLLDDELGKLASTIPTGVRLTVVLDSCFSGTGTKALGPRRRKTQLISVADTAFKMAGGDKAANVGHLLTGGVGKLKALRSEPKKLVVARFIEPNAKHQELLATHKVNKLGRSLRAAELNHELLSAASDSQTAADAFIDGEYHGAFSFFLSKSAKDRGRESTTQLIIDDVRRSLQDGGYSQTPQIEGPFAGDILFGGTRAPGPPNSGPHVTNTPSPINQSSLAAASSAVTPAAPLSSLDRFLNLADRILDIADRLSRADQEAAKHTLEFSGRAPPEVVVYVHGISQHRPGYSDPWWNAMRPYLTRPLTKTEMVWSDIVNPRSTQLRSAITRATPEHIVLRTEIEAELSRRIETMHRSTGRTRVSRDISTRAKSETRGDGISLDDFLLYMLDSSVRNQILQRFDSVVRPLLDNGATVHVISHSWGTVVAYEGLRNLDSVSLSGRVANLFVVGSALSIGAVQSNLFGRVTDGREPSHVERLINLDAGGDAVGGTIAGQFDVDAEHLGLQPVGCATIPFTNIALSLSCAHGSYFRATNIAVNRDIFASAIV